jgi:hypothetical protein
LDVRVELTLRLPHGELDRILNAGHAALHEAVARHLDKLPGWVHLPEVSFAVYGERGVIDILAFHQPTGSLLVIELKTELVSLEDLLSAMDIRMRHAAAIARERGWVARSVSGWIVVAESDTNRRRVQSYGAALRSGYPSDGRRMHAWLVTPSDSIKAVSFWANATTRTLSGGVAGRRRVRKRASGAEQALTPASR